MKKNSIFVGLIFLSINWLGLEGCSPSYVKLPVAFDSTSAKNQLKPGPYGIAGKILFEPDKGHALAYPDSFVSCAGYEVTLIPYTDFAREWALSYFGKPVTDVSYRLTKRGRQINFAEFEQFMEVTKKTQCDEQGIFNFFKVAKGDYYLLARVQWLGKDEAKYQFGYAPEDIDEEDGFVIKKFTVSNTDVSLTGPWP